MIQHRPQLIAATILFRREDHVTISLWRIKVIEN